MLTWHTDEKGDDPQALGPEQLVARSLSNGMPAGHGSELYLHHRKVYSRSSSYKQQVGREPCKGRKKAEIHLAPTSVL